MHARRGTAGAVALHVVAPRPLAAAFPKILGRLPAFGMIFHISENARPFASEPPPSVHGACDPGSIAWAKPLPRTGIALAGSAMQVALSLALLPHEHDSPQQISSNPEPVPLGAGERP